MKNLIGVYTTHIVRIVCITTMPGRSNIEMCTYSDVFSGSHSVSVGASFSSEEELFDWNRKKLLDKQANLCVTSF